MTAILDRRAPTIFGDGEQSRDFTYVEDVVRLNLLAARTKGISGKMYNGGNGGRITPKQAWSALQKIEGGEIGAPYCPARAGGVIPSHAATTAPHAEPGYRPPVSF